MRFLDKDWKKLTLISYTAWAFYALVFLTIAPDLIYLTTGVDTNPRVWSMLTLLACIGGLVGRMVLQPHATRWRRRIITCVLLALIGFVSVPALSGEADTEFDEVAFRLISKWEGKRNNSYRDMVGVWTICYGHTATAGPGQYKNDAECQALLVREIHDYRHGLHAYFTLQTKTYRLPPARDVAYTSLAYNIGVRRAGRSTATRRLNSGDIVGGCAAITWWNRAGGRVVRGLVRRRKQEQSYCMTGT